MFGMEQDLLDSFLDLRSVMGRVATLVINGKTETGRVAHVCLQKGLSFQPVGSDQTVVISDLSQVSLAN